MMTKFGSLTRFAASVNIDPQLIRCSEKEMFDLVRFVRSISSNVLPSPYRYILAQLEGEKRYCQFEFDQTNSRKFDLYYLYDLGDDDPEVHVKHFSHTTNFANWDPFLPGNTYADYSKTVLNFSMIANSNITETSWKEYAVFFGNRTTLKTPQMLVTSPTFNTNSQLSAFSGISLMTSDIAHLLQNLYCGVRNAKYALLNIDNLVIIENEIGAIHPLNFNFNTPIYPSLDQINSTFWNNISEQLKLHNDTEIFDLLYEDTTYLIMKQPVYQLNQRKSHTFVVCFPLDPRIEYVLYPMSQYFIGGIIVLFILFFLSYYIVKMSETSRKKKLLKSQIVMNNTPYQEDLYLDDLGSIPKSIQQIRTLQLKFPDDTILNKVLDSVVENLSMKKSQQFEIQKGRCEFCDFLAPNPTEFIEDYKEEPYKIWKSLTLQPLKLHKMTTFPIIQFVQKPKIMLIRFMMTLINDGKLLIPPFDPDCMIQFLIKTDAGVKNPIHASLMLYSLHYLLNGSFNYWITNKIDILILYFATYFSQFSVRKYKEEVNDDDSDSSSTMECHYISNQAFNDDYTIVEENLEFLHDLFIEIFPVDENEATFKYFWKCIKKILFSTRYHALFELLGEAQVRIQSPEFSVHSDFSDRLLFMKAIIKLCDFCDYWSPEDIMLKATSISDNLFFSKEENEDQIFISSFHYEFASKIVMPWITLFANFKPIEYLVTNNTKTIQYWQSIRYSLEKEPDYENCM